MGKLSLHLLLLFSYLKFPDKFCVSLLHPFAHIKAVSMDAGLIAGHLYENALPLYCFFFGQAHHLGASALTARVFTDKKFHDFRTVSAVMQLPVKPQIQYGIQFPVLFCNEAVTIIIFHLFCINPGKHVPVQFPPDELADELINALKVVNRTFSKHGSTSLFLNIYELPFIIRPS